VGVGDEDVRHVLWLFAQRPNRIEDLLGAAREAAIDQRQLGPILDEEDIDRADRKLVNARKDGCGCHGGILLLRDEFKI
jgi:hypothetical protein